MLQGLIVATEQRITPQLLKIMQYLTCSLRRENCDTYVTRLAAGVISDLANHVGEGFV